MELGRFRVIKLDKYNLTFEEYKEVENTKTKEKSMKWVRVGNYYGNLGQCLKALKDYIIAERINEKDLDLIKLLDELNNSYVSTCINTKEVQPTKKVMIYSNEHKAWWKPYYFGYTQCSKEAGIFDLEEAVKRYPKLDYDTSNEDFLVDITDETKN